MLAAYGLTAHDGALVPGIQVADAMDAAHGRGPPAGDGGALVCQDLERAGLGPLPDVLAVATERLPLAYPLLMTGLRSAAVQVVATATLPPHLR